MAAEHFFAKAWSLRFERFSPVNSNTTGTITPMFSSYDWMKPNLKQKARTGGLGKVTRSEKFVFERKYA